MSNEVVAKFIVASDVCFSIIFLHSTRNDFWIYSNQSRFGDMTSLGLRFDRLSKQISSSCECNEGLVIALAMNVVKLKISCDVKNR